MDKDNLHIDSEFMDHSWQNMSELLDQEMPIQKRKRRLLWVWFFGIGFLLLGSYAYLNRSIPTDIKSLPISLPILRKSSDDLQVVSTLINLTETIPTVANSTTAVGTSVPETVDTSVSEPIIAKKEVITLIKPSIKRIALPALTRLPNIPVSLLSNKKLEESLPVFPTKNRPDWKFGVYAGALVPQFGSFRTGLHANVSFTPKWALHFGLGYAKRIPTVNTSFSPNAHILAPPVLEMEEADMSTAGAGAAPIDPGANEMEVIAVSGFQYTNFHYFEVPILAQYKIRPRLSIELGGNLGYLYGYRYHFNEASFFTNSINNNNTSFSTNSATNLSQENIGNLNRISLTFVSGVNYQLTKQLKGYANFHFSNQYLVTEVINTNLVRTDINTNEPAKRWKQIEVGIRYYFK